ncbi:MAG: phosphodiester glycosidase family protein [bacterium]|nr:phosphodiester glycosidase family protein [bacterium]
MSIGYNQFVRNVLLTIICGIAVFSLAYFGNYLRGLYDINKNSLSPIVNLSATPAPKNSPNIIDLDSNYRLTWVLEEDLSKLKLYSNLTQEKTAKKLYEEGNCKALVNGGFYSKEDTHIGLFVTSEGKLNDKSNNDLFDGFFTVNKGIAAISNTPPTEEPTIALQAGPTLFRNSKPIVLSIKNDENERRTAVATTSKGDVIFLMFYNKESTYLGPKLEEVPELLNEFSRLTGIPITSALNLDGGTASAFYTDGVSLGELTKIGSYFCILD